MVEPGATVVHRVSRLVIRSPGRAAPVTQALLSYLYRGRVLVARVDGRGPPAARGRRDRSYQRRGFRMRAIDRDAFTEATGYPPGTRVEGIPLRDRVWLDMELRR